MHTLQARRGLLVAFVVLALVGAACGNSATAGQGGGEGATATTTVTEGPDNGYTFSPSTVTVNRGDTLTLKNVSDDSHTFTVTGESIDVETQPEHSAKVTIDLPPGTYPFICRFHKELGMTGTLTVR